MSRMKEQIFNHGNISSIMKIINDFLINKLTFLNLNIYFLSLSCIFARKAQNILCLNGSNLWIKDLDIFWKYGIWLYVIHHGNNARGFFIFINMVASFRDIENNNSELISISGFLILSSEKENYMTIQNQSIWYEWVSRLDQLRSCIHN